MDTKEIATVKNFMAAINERNVSKLSDLMTEDHTIKASDGKAHSGRKKMSAGWKEYYCMFPVYKVEVQSILQEGNLAAAFGSAAGTYNEKRGLVPENRIEMLAAGGPL